MQIDQFTRVVLASALATKVKWEAPFEVVPAAEHCGVASPWKGAVSRFLWDAEADSRAMIARTDAAGVVAVHCAVAREDLTVVSVSGAPEVDRTAMLAGAYEVAATVCGEWGKGACSLFDLPLGAGHSWEISEREVPVFVPEPRIERVAGAALPAWHVEGTLDLTRSSAFGTATGASMLFAQLIGPRPDDECQATQAAVASFTRYGFEAAAVTALGIRTAAAAPARRSTRSNAPPCCASTIPTPPWRSRAGRRECCGACRSGRRGPTRRSPGCRCSPPGSTSRSSPRTSRPHSAVPPIPARRPRPLESPDTRT